MQERIGVIDLGSNTTRLIVMAYQGHHCFRMIDEIRETVRLAQGVTNEGLLQPAAIYRAVEALKMFHTLCHANNVQHVVAVGTSALRDAVNRDEFLATLKREADLDMRILSGQEEAYYGYLGVVNSLPIYDGFVVDIGGGSTEITEVCARQFEHWLSEPAGIIRFTERYVNSDPISNDDFRVLKQAARKTFDVADWLQSGEGHVLVGLGGTVRNLARIDQKRRKYPLERVHGYVMTRKALAQTIKQLRKKDLSARKSISGLNKDRADVVLAGAVILDQVMQQGGFEEIMISGQGLREGLFYEHFLRHQEKPLLEDVPSFSVQNLTAFSTYEPVHSAKVREISWMLFDKLQPLHGYGQWERELLGHAAMLHDIGVQVGYYDHHKHSEYLLVNNAVPGFTQRELALLAILVRSHRKGDPKSATYAEVLEEGDDTRAAQLSAMLRLAEYLERSKSQVVQDLTIEFDLDTVRIWLHPQDNADPTVEIWDASQRAGLFKKAFKRTVEFQAAES